MTEFPVMMNSYIPWVLKLEQMRSYTRYKGTKMMTLLERQCIEAIMQQQQCAPFYLGHSLCIVDVNLS